MRKTQKFDWKVLVFLNAAKWYKIQKNRPTFELVQAGVKFNESMNNSLVIYRKYKMATSFKIYWKLNE